MKKDKTLVGGASSLDPQSFDPICDPIFPFIMMICVTLFEPEMAPSVCVLQCGTFANQKEYIFVSHGVGLVQIKRVYFLCPTVWEFYLELFKLSLE